MLRGVILAALLITPAFADSVADTKAAACKQILTDAQAVHAGDAWQITDKLAPIIKRFRALGCDPNIHPPVK